jgi:hypothetical protein
MPKLKPLKINKRKFRPTKFIKIRAKLISTKLINCNLNRSECTQTKIFLAAINTKTKCCTRRFFNDKAMYQHLLLLMKMIL